MSERRAHELSLSDQTTEASSAETRVASREAALRSAKPIRARACRSHLRKHLAREWPTIVEALVEGAKSGSVSHTNLAAKLAGLDFRAGPQQKQKPPQKSFARQLLEETEKLEKKNIEQYGPL